MWKKSLNEPIEENNQRALAVYQRLFPSLKVVPFSADSIEVSGGS
jgi:hypothetical protein